MRKIIKTAEFLFLLGPANLPIKYSTARRMKCFNLALSCLSYYTVRKIKFIFVQNHEVLILGISFTFAPQKLAL